MILVEDDKVEMDLAKIFKDRFGNIVKSLHIECPCKVDLDRNPVVSAIKNFKASKYFKNNRKNPNSSLCFSFQKVSNENLLSQLNCLHPTKTTQKCDIITNIIKKEL